MTPYSVLKWRARCWQPHFLFSTEDYMRTQWMALLTATALISSAAAAQDSSGFAVLSGGVGANDREMIEAQQHNYSLKLVFSGQGGAFLSGVNVSLADKSGSTVLSSVTDGPILLAAAPAGTYKMTATAQGITKSMNVTAGKSLRTYQISFPISDDPELTDSDGSYLPKAASSMDNYNRAPVGYAPSNSMGYAPAAPAPAPAYAYPPTHTHGE